MVQVESKEIEELATLLRQVAIGQFSYKEVAENLIKNGYRKHPSGGAKILSNETETHFTVFGRNPYEHLIPLDEAKLSRLLLKLFPSREKVDSINTNSAAKEIIKRFGQKLPESVTNSHQLKLPLKLPLRRLTYEHIEINEMIEHGSRYNAGYNDALDEVKKLNEESK